jgi:diguanylate cyclase
MMNVTQLHATYDLWMVMASLIVATLAGYVSLELSHRAELLEAGAAIVWRVAGSVALGTGIWSMHFVGMLAYSLPIALGYTKAYTVLSWVAAVLVSAVALSIATRRSLTSFGMAVGSLSMGLGICAMHYIGMLAIDVTPVIVWNVWLVALSALIATIASAVALTMFFWLRKTTARKRKPYRLGAAIVIGLAISGTHYTGMAAASFPSGTVCLSAGSLAGNNLGLLVALASTALLILTLGTSVFDAMSRELKSRALLDVLTSLPNRSLFEARLARAIARCTDGAKAFDQSSKLAVLCVNLDGFKSVNDSLGHSAGDLVLVEASRRLRAIPNEAATVARAGSDEFLILLEGQTLVDSTRLANCLVADIAAPFHVAGQKVEISSSIGIVLYPDHGSADKLIANAYSAMHIAKRTGGNGCTIFESQVDENALEQLNLQNDLRHAVELGQMQLHYQPKVDSRRGHIVGVEALLRWKHPVHGMVSPAIFIPIAERSGIISSLGSWVIDETCRQMAQWAGEGLRMRVAINISVHQLREASLVNCILRALERHNVHPSQLLCEITESLAMDDIKATQSAFEILAQSGVFLSIDDFGTGHSSLSYLRQLPARQLKIDKSFIDDLEPSNDARAIVDAIIRLAHALGLRVVAEGVETEAQRNILRRLGCDELQGYFFAKPMPAEVLLTWTRDQKTEGRVQFSPSIFQQAA